MREKLTNIWVNYMTHLNRINILLILTRENLHGWTITQPLPYLKFNWLYDNKI